MSRTILIQSPTPLASLWALGLAAGPYRDARCVLALIDRKKPGADPIAQACSTTAASPIAEVVEFPRIGKRFDEKWRRGRAVADAVARHAREAAPSQVLGNDRRIEFHAALNAAPAASGVFVDEGWGAYRGAKRIGAGRRWARRLFGPMAAALRQGTYGTASEKPDLVGGSAAVRESWLMLPMTPNPALAGKPARHMEADWFRAPGVLAVCAEAVRLCGLDPQAVSSARLVLVLPHDAYLREHPELRQGLLDLAQTFAARGERVAYKFHPRSSAGALPIDGPAFELPRRMPLELLVPLLDGALVAGAMSSALMYLPRLGARVELAALLPEADRDHPMTRIYRELGIRILDSAGQ